MLKKKLRKKKPIVGSMTTQKATTSYFEEMKLKDLQRRNETANAQTERVSKTSAAGCLRARKQMNSYLNRTESVKNGSAKD